MRQRFAMSTADRRSPAHPTGDGMSQRMSVWRSLALGMVGFTFTLGLRAETGADAPRLIDHASSHAVFEYRGELLRVAVDGPIPATPATLRHVGAGSVEIEYVASSQSTGGILILERGNTVPAALPADPQLLQPLPRVDLIEREPAREAAEDADAAPASASTRSVDRQGQ